MSASTAILAEGLGHSFGKRAALSGVDLHIAAGETFAILGPNGSGKTTLFRILATLLIPARGRAAVAGRDVVREPRDVRRAIGVVFQSPALDRKLSVRENLLHQGHLQGMHGRTLIARIDALLAVFGIRDRAKERVEILSGGLARRCDLARAMLPTPQVLLLDEPTSGLDPAARRDLLDFLARSRDEERTTSVLSTHLLEEAERCDRVALLDEGRVVALGRPADLVREIGAQVITLTTSPGDEEAVAASLERLFGAGATVSPGIVRLEREDAATFLPRILASVPGRVRSATVASPTLEDVFFRKTGRRFEETRAEQGVLEKGAK
jgi:ABC-2 type transport system ATP-binding protein